MSVLPPDLPLAPGTIADCEEYHDHREGEDMIDWAQEYGYQCRYITGLYMITPDQLVSWNPSLIAD
jgi:hypothetical protein